MTELMQRILPTVQKPARYTGGEWGEIKKDLKDVRVRVAFCFPDTYEIGMSNLGMRILYGVMNGMDGVWCERVFAPWGDMEQAMRDNSLPLWALESQTPVREFDMIAFTIGYEMAYSNILNMLNLAGVPLRSKDRQGLKNIVFAGGVCAFNPEPLADFIDFFSLGEGEDITVEILQLYDRAKAEGLARADIDSRLCAVAVAGAFTFAIFERPGEGGGAGAGEKDAPASDKSFSDQLVDLLICGMGTPGAVEDFAAEKDLRADGATAAAEPPSSAGPPAPEEPTVPAGSPAPAE